MTLTGTCYCGNVNGADLAPVIIRVKGTLIIESGGQLNGDARGAFGGAGGGGAAGYGGGGCYECNYGIISKVTSCTAGGYGGGCYGCSYSTISYVENCNAATSGGGCYSCTNVFLSGRFNNTVSESGVRNIANGSYMGQFTYTNSSYQIIQIQTSGTSLATTDLS